MRPAPSRGARRRRRRGRSPPRRRASACTSVSRIAAPCASARSKATSVFSGASPLAPRWPITIGRGSVEVGVAHARVRYRARPMAVLTRDALLAEIAAGALALEPLDAGRGRARLDRSHARRRDPRARSPGPIRSRSARTSTTALYTRVASLERRYVLAPGRDDPRHHARAHHAAADLCGFLEGRSRFARLGLMIHVTSAFVQPGVSNRQVLEMSNVSGPPARDPRRRAPLPARADAHRRRGRLPRPLRATRSDL